MAPQLTHSRPSEKYSAVSTTSRDTQCVRDVHREVEHNMPIKIGAVFSITRFKSCSGYKNAARETFNKHFLVWYFKVKHEENLHSLFRNEHLTRRHWQISVFLWLICTKYQKIRLTKFYNETDTLWSDRQPNMRTDSSEIFQQNLTFANENAKKQKRS